MPGGIKATLSVHPRHPKHALGCTWPKCERRVVCPRWCAGTAVQTRHYAHLVGEGVHPGQVGCALDAPYRCMHIGQARCTPDA